MIELIPRYKSSKVLKPADGTFDFPPSSVASEFSSILRGRFDAIAFVRGDEVDAAFEKSRSQWVTVCSSVVDQLARSTAYDSIGQQRLDEINFMRTGTLNHVAARRAVAVGQQHDLRPFASLGLAYAKTPFFADENVPSASDSSRSISPCRSSLLTKRAHAFLNKPDSVHCFSRRQQVGYDGKRSGKSRQRAPVRNIQAIASKQSREAARGRPPSGDGCGSLKRSEIKPHWSSVSSNSGSILDPTLDSASAEWDRCDISLFPFENCTHTTQKRFDLNL
jgi:hypothetical protein